MNRRRGQPACVPRACLTCRARQVAGACGAGMREACECMCCVVHAQHSSGAWAGQWRASRDAVSWWRGVEATVPVVCSLQSITLKRTRRVACCMALVRPWSLRWLPQLCCPPNPKGVAIPPRAPVVDLLETAEVFLAHRHSLPKAVLLSQQSLVTSGGRRHWDQNAILDVTLIS